MTTPADDGPEIHPNVLFLFDLLNWVRQGRVRAAAFQRDYVWGRKDILALFESVRARYPIGTLLFWSDPTGGHHPEGPNRLGPFELPPAPASSLWVLDGQQRLTTLAGVLLNTVLKPSSTDRDPGRWRVYFDAAEDRFTHLKTVDTAVPWQVPASALSDTKSMFNAVGELYKLTDDELPLSPKDQETSATHRLSKDDLAARIQTVARALQSYKLPVVEFRTSDLNLAVESFTLLNKRGVTIGPDEMFAALTYQTGAQHGFDIAGSVTAAKAGVEALNFGEVERLVVLRTFLVVAGLDPYRTDWKRLGKDTQETAAKNLPKAMERATRGLQAAVAFLREEGMYNTRLLPYGLQLLGIAVWFAENPSPTDASKLLLRRWLWLTSFSAWFGQGNPSRYARLFQEMAKAARAVEQGGAPPEEFSQLPWSTRAIPFPKAFDFRSARARAWLCLMVRDGTVRPNGDRVGPEELARQIGERGPAMLRRVVASSKDFGTSPANRVFEVFDDTTQAQARSLLRDHPSIAPSFWETHLLDEAIQGPKATPAKLDELLRERERRLMEKELTFLRSLDLLPYEGAAMNAPIDTDGDPPPELDELTES